MMTSRFLTSTTTLRPFQVVRGQLLPGGPQQLGFRSRLRLCAENLHTVSAVPQMGVMARMGYRTWMFFSVDMNAFQW